MDAEAIKLLERAITGGISSVLLLVVLGAVAAGLGAFGGAYLRKRGEEFALREGFANVLAQLEAQTKLTENIKTALGEELYYKTEILMPRLSAYRQLWALTEVVKLTRSVPLGQADKEKLASDMTSWYYKDGNGLFLSIEAGRLFRQARGTLAAKSVTDAVIKKKFSLLRTQLKNDVKVYGPQAAGEELGM